MSTGSELLKALGIGGATIGGGAALHGMGWGDVLAPLDYPRKALYNTVASPFRAMQSGNASDLIGMIPGIAGGALGGLVGGPLGVLAGSALGGALYGAGEASGRPEFNAPSVSDLTGTEDFLPNMAAGVLTDPLTFAGLGQAWRGAKGALAGGEALSTAKAAESAIPVAKLAEPIAQEAKPIAEAAQLRTPPAQLEQAVPTAERVQAPFYSRLERAIERLGNKPIGVPALENRLQKVAKEGFSSEELQHTLGDLLESKKPGDTVTKDELLNHFRQNQIKVEEVMHGDVPADQEFKRVQYMDRNTPGGENHHELIMTMPRKSPPSLTSEEMAWMKNADKRIGTLSPDERARYQDLFNRESAANYPRKQPSYETEHWPGVENPVVHVRFNDRTGANGERILHIEEVQSDLHQQGKKGAYEGTPKANEIYAKDNELMQLLAESNRTPETDITAHASLEARIHELQTTSKPGDVVPDLPFKDSSHELALKRMIRYAADNGYDAITLNTGEQAQAITGGKLSGQQQWYDKTLPNYLKKYAKTMGVEVKPGEVSYISPDTAIDAKDMLPVSAYMPITDEVRRRAFRGQPLMGLGGATGGSALLAALAGQQQT
jgi:hypothetical protein